MSRSDNERIEDILRASRRLREIGKAGREAFNRSWPHQSAAVRELEIIGEAVKHLSDDFMESKPELPADLARGLRNRATHRYWTIDLDTIWNTVKDDIGPLIEMLKDEYTPPPSGSVFDEDHSFPAVELTE